MKILVTGNKGYIGSVLTQILIEKGYEVLGLDSNYFDECRLLELTEKYPHLRIDIRDVELKSLEGIDAVIHLAALSNDPLGELTPGLTEQINLDGTLHLARLAKQAGVKRFIYSSSQSMYGISRAGEELDEDDSEKNAITAYAKTKWAAECELKNMQDENFSVICFRPSTVFGVSPRMRCDIVFNNLVACAFTTGKIEIKSDGTPWRPVVHIRDVCAAFIAGLEAPKNLVHGRSYNVGIEGGNYTVKDLAMAAQRAVPGSKLIFTGEHGGDSRTYRVSFFRILNELKGYYSPQWDLDKGGKELVTFFKSINFNEEVFRGRMCNRLAQIQFLQGANKLDASLRTLS